MVVHFPIALLFTAFLLDVVAFWRRNPFWERMGIIILGLGVLGLGAAIAAGFIAESQVLPTAQVAPILAAHRRDGLITGGVFLVVLGVRWYVHRRWAEGTPERREAGRGGQRVMSSQTVRLWVASLGSYLIGLTLLSATGVVGGSMVYDHGLGVATPPPVTAGARRTPTASGNPDAAAGARVWRTTCARCHGTTPPFTSAIVTSRGDTALITFIADNMPPGAPVGTSTAKQVVAYLKTLK
jgi:uncharacterized membrane protein